MFCFLGLINCSMIVKIIIWLLDGRINVFLVTDRLKKTEDCLSLLHAKTGCHNLQMAFNK